MLNKAVNNLLVTCRKAHELHADILKTADITGHVMIQGRNVILSLNDTSYLFGDSPEGELARYERYRLAGEVLEVIDGLAGDRGSVSISGFSDLRLPQDIYHSDDPVSHRYAHRIKRCTSLELV